MINSRCNNPIFHAPAVIRRVLTAWLFAVTVEYCLLPEAFKDLRELSGLREMSFLRVILLTAFAFIILSIINRNKTERWLMVGFFSVLSVVSLYASFTLPFLIADCLILLILIVYAVCGWNSAPTNTIITTITTGKRPWSCVAAIASAAFFLFVSIWTVCRVLTFSTPTYDFGIFSQMFHSMKTTGLPMTTVERDGLLSHFHVHVSPIYYLLLPFYYLFPYPATLQVLQAAVLASAVIPLWLVGKQHGLHPGLRILLCILLVLYPAYSGGASYDIHENAFLTPLILWLFYGVDRKSKPITILSSVLVLMVKEDAAVYVGVIALYYFLCGLLRRERFAFITGFLLMAMAVIWFVGVTGYLARVGDGVMTYRYKNFMFDDTGSLLTVVKSVLMSPMKAVFECVDPEKLKFIGLTILPLAAVPLFTRKYERMILLIPYVLVNLMSDYQYQHDIFFQYTYGSTACLFYLTAVNLSDFKTNFNRFVALFAAVCICGVCFVSEVIPKAMYYPRKYISNRAIYAQTKEALSLIPEDASVSATTFYTTYLSQRSVLYDVRYASEDHILSTEYVVLSVKDDGFEEMIIFLESNHYVLYAEQDDTLVIYRRLS